MKNLINRENLINGVKLAAVAAIFQAVIATTPETAIAQNDSIVETPRVEASV